MGLLKNILKSSNNFLQHKRGNVPKLVLLKCTVLYYSAAAMMAAVARRRGYIRLTNQDSLSRQH